VLVRGRGEADYVVAVLAASLALQSEGYVIIVSKDTDVPLEALREVEVAVADAPLEERAGLRQRLLDSVLWTTSSADARRVPLAAFVTSDSPLLLALAALLSGRDTVSQLVVGAAFMTIMRACRKLDGDTLAAAQKLYEVADSDTAAWLAPVLAVLRVPGAPTTISDEYAEQLQRHDEARRAARQCGVEVALKIQTGATFDTTSAAALRFGLEESAPLLLGALKRCRSRDSVWQLLAKKADSLAKAPAPAQPQKLTVHAMHLHFNGDRVPRADQDRARHEREKDKKKTARASAKTQAQAQLAAAARNKLREVPTLVAQHRHELAKQRAVDLKPDPAVLAALEAKRKARLERRAARRAERDKHIAELRDAALHSSAKQARRKAQAEAKAAEAQAQAQEQKSKDSKARTAAAAADAADAARVGDVTIDVTVVASGVGGNPAQPAVFEVAAPGVDMGPVAHTVLVRAVSAAWPVAATVCAFSPYEYDAKSKRAESTAGDGSQAPAPTRAVLHAIALPPGRYIAEVVFGDGFKASAFVGSKLRPEALALRERLRAMATARGYLPRDVVVLARTEEFVVPFADDAPAFAMSSWPQRLVARLGDDCKQWLDKDGTVGHVHLCRRVKGRAKPLPFVVALYCTATGANVSKLYDIECAIDILRGTGAAPAATAPAASSSAAAAAPIASDADPVVLATLNVQATTKRDGSDIGRKRGDGGRCFHVEVAETSRSTSGALCASR
jgi:hypothetical protein